MFKGKHILPVLRHHIDGSTNSFAKSCPITHAIEEWLPTGWVADTGDTRIDIIYRESEYVDAIVGLDVEKELARQIEAIDDCSREEWITRRLTYPEFAIVLDFDNGVADIAANQTTVVSSSSLRRTEVNLTELN